MHYLFALFLGDLPVNSVGKWYSFVFVMCFVILDDLCLPLVCFDVCVLLIYFGCWLVVVFGGIVVV